MQSPKTAITKAQDASKDRLSNFSEGDSVLVARNEFYKGEKLCPRWGAACSITKAQNNWVLDSEDLPSGDIYSIHDSILKSTGFVHWTKRL